MSSSVVRRQKFRKSPPQPLDRHLAELGDFDGSIYINAGIDSTWYVESPLKFYLIFHIELVVKNVEERYINLPMVLWYHLLQFEQQQQNER
jgi:hypothetical protein